MQLFEWKPLASGADRQTKGHQLRPHALRSARHRETHAFRNFSVDAAAVVVPARRGPKVHYYRYGFRRASESSTTRQPAQLVYLSCVSSALAARGRRRLSATCSRARRARKHDKHSETAASFFSALCVVVVDQVRDRFAPHRRVAQRTHQHTATSKQVSTSDEFDRTDSTNSKMLWRIINQRARTHTNEPRRIAET